MARSAVYRLLCLQTIRGTSVLYEVAPPIRTVGSVHGVNIDSTQERVSLLSRNLNCQEAEIRMAVQKYPRLLKVRESKLVDTIQILNHEGISTDEILTYPDIFTHSLRSLKKRIEELKELGFDKIKLVSLRESSRIYGRRIQRIVQDRDTEVPYHSKVELLQDYLKITENEALGIISSNPGLDNMKLSTLKAKMDLLNDFQREFLLDKIWILLFPIDVLEYRLRILKSSNITYENCDSFSHLLTCEEKYFAQRLRMHEVDRQILGNYGNKREYLKARIGCNDDEIENMIRRNHKLMSTKLPKLKAHLDFVLEELNLNPSDLVTYPRFFNFAASTVRKRNEELRNLGFKNITIRELALETRSYNRLVEYWRK